MADDMHFLATGITCLKERFAMELGTGNPFALPCAHIVSASGGAIRKAPSARPVFHEQLVDHVPTPSIAYPQGRTEDPEVGLSGFQGQRPIAHHPVRCHLVNA